MRLRRSLLIALPAVGLAALGARRVAGKLAGGGLLRERPSGLLRVAFRLPILLYRLRLGWLAGHRTLLLTHRGRRSGMIHQTVLEVVRYDPLTRESVVVSGWGERADWYRNLRAHPAVEVRTGHDCYAPVQRFLTAEETAEEFKDYARHYPRYARVFAGQLGVDLDGSDAAYRAVADRVRMVALRPSPDVVEIPRGFQPR